MAHKIIQQLTQRLRDILPCPTELSDIIQEEAVVLDKQEENIPYTMHCERTAPYYFQPAEIPATSYYVLFQAGEQTLQTNDRFMYCTLERGQRVMLSYRNVVEVRQGKDGAEPERKIVGHRIEEAQILEG